MQKLLAIPSLCLSFSSNLFEVRPSRQRNKVKSPGPPTPWPPFLFQLPPFAAWIIPTFVTSRQRTTAYFPPVFANPPQHREDPLQCLQSRRPERGSLTSLHLLGAAWVKEGLGAQCPDGATPCPGIWVLFPMLQMGKSRPQARAGLEGTELQPFSSHGTTTWC